MEAQYEDDEGYAEMEYNDKSQDEGEEREYTDNPANGSDDGAGPAPKSPDHFLAAAGFDDSDVDDMVSSRNILGVFAVEFLHTRVHLWFSEIFFKPLTSRALKIIK